MRKLSVVSDVLWVLNVLLVFGVFLFVFLFILFGYEPPPNPRQPTQPRDSQVGGERKSLKAFEAIWSEALGPGKVTTPTGPSFESLVEIKEIYPGTGAIIKYMEGGTEKKPMKWIGEDVTVQGVTATLKEIRGDEVVFECQGKEIILRKQ